MCLEQIYRRFEGAHVRAPQRANLCNVTSYASKVEALLLLVRLASFGDFEMLVDVSAFSQRRNLLEGRFYAGSIFSPGTRRRWNRLPLE